MQNRRNLCAGLLVGAGLLAMSAGHAEAETVTFAVSAGSLGVSAPASADLGSASTNVLGTTVSGQLGSTTVSDLRGAVAGSWTVTVSISDFTTGTGTGNQTIAKANVSVFSGVASTTGVAVVVPTTSLTAVGDGGTLISATGVVGSATTSYNPTATVSVPASAAAGTYTGTITQTVL